LSPVRRSDQSFTDTVDQTQYLTRCLSGDVKSESAVLLTVFKESLSFLAKVEKALTYPVFESGVR